MKRSLFSRLFQRFDKRKILSELEQQRKEILDMGDRLDLKMAKLDNEQNWFSVECLPRESPKNGNSKTSSPIDIPA